MRPGIYPRRRDWPAFWNSEVTLAPRSRLDTGSAHRATRRRRARVEETEPMRYVTADLQENGAMAVEQRGVARDIAMKVAISSLVVLAFGSNHSLLLMSTDQVTAATFSVVSASNLTHRQTPVSPNPCRALCVFDET